jgi:hypothetical protein
VPPLLQLPEAPQPGPAALALPRDQQLPPLLIINLQLPWYPVSLTEHPQQLSVHLKS